MVVITQRGSFKNLDKFFANASKANYLAILEKYGREGVAALASATPIESGVTSGSWSYEISNSGGSYKLSWCNSHVIDGVQIAVIIQYGHGTRNGGYVQGRDYINPAIRPIFDKIADESWREVTKV